MQYVDEVLDRKTGNMVIIPKGDWVTITELGERYGVGRKHVRSILRQMNFLFVEAGTSHQRHRLCPWVIEKGWGKRLTPKYSVPFDVVGPDAQQWIDEHWQAAVKAIEDAKSGPTKDAQAALEAFRSERNAFRRSHGNDEMTTEEQVSWLSDHFPKLTQTEIASVVGVTQQIVARNLSKRNKHKQELERLRKTTPERHTCEPSGTQLDNL